MYVYTVATKASKPHPTQTYSSNEEFSDEQEIASLSEVSDDLVVDSAVAINSSKSVKGSYIKNKCML